MHRSVSLKSHIQLLIIVVLVPMLVALGYFIYQKATYSIEQETTSITTLTALIAGNTHRTLIAGRTALEGLAKRPLIQAVDGRRCDPILNDYPELFPRYANLGVIDLTGTIVCSAVPQPGWQKGQCGEDGMVPAINGRKGVSCGQCIYRADYRQVGFGADTADIQ